MKNIFRVLIILLISDCLLVNAETFYSDYYLLKENTSEYYEESDTLKRKEVKYYNNYYEVMTNENYYLFNQNPDSAPYINQNDFNIYKMYLFDYNEYCLGPYSTFLIKENAQTRYLQFKAFYNQKTSVENIRVFNNEKEINYNIYSTNYIFGDLTTYSSEIIIDLNNLFLFENLRIEVELSTESTVELYYTIYSYEKDPLKNIYEHLFVNMIIRSGNKELNTLNFVTNNDFVSLATDLDWIANENIKRIASVNYFIEKKIEYKYYNLERFDIEAYTINPLDNHFHNFEDYKTFYTYYQREKFEILDEITSVNDSLIIFSTLPVDNIKIISDINLNKNGKYKVKFIVDEGFYFIKKIIVNIPRNNNSVELKSIPSIKEPLSNVKMPEEESFIKKDNSFNWLLLFFSLIMLLICLFKRKKNS